MNESRRKRLRTARSMLDNAGIIIGDVMENERDALDNWPESLQESERYADAMEACDEIEDILSQIHDASSRLHEVSH